MKTGMMYLRIQKHQQIWTAAMKILLSDKAKTCCRIKFMLILVKDNYSTKMLNKQHKGVNCRFYGLY